MRYYPNGHFDHLNNRFKFVPFYIHNSIISKPFSSLPLRDIINPEGSLKCEANFPRKILN